jgi:hypothetical protein
LLIGVINVPFDPVDPPDEPPEGVLQALLWRVAVQLHRDHELEENVPGPPRCSRCGEPWPCAGRRLAERGLVAAFAPAEEPGAPEGSSGKSGEPPAAIGEPEVGAAESSGRPDTEPT